jgi:hypothetical protein
MISGALLIPHTNLFHLYTPLLVLKQEYLFISSLISRCMYADDKSSFAAHLNLRLRGSDGLHKKKVPFLKYGFVTLPL